MFFSMTSRPRKPQAILPSDKQHHFGGILFLVSLLVFFLSSILLYGIYAYSRRGDPESASPLPSMFLLSTLCLLVISGLVHMATRAIRREKRLLTSMLLLISGITAVVFMGLQFDAMSEMLQGPAMNNGTGKGVAGMVVVLAILHAVHVAGGVVALTVVAIRSWLGRYDHERHWPVDFAAQYWHFLDVVWLCMLLAFCLTTGGFVL